MSAPIPLKHQCLGEFFGTGLFIFLGVSCLIAAIICGVTLSLWEIAAVWGLSITLAIYLSAGISGAHLNPAVTIALTLFAGFDIKKSSTIYIFTNCRRFRWCSVILLFVSQFVY